MRMFSLALVLLLGSSAFTADTTRELVKTYKILEGFSIPEYFASSLTEHPEELKQIGTLTVVFQGDNLTNQSREGFNIHGYIKSLELVPEDELKVLCPANYLAYKIIMNSLRKIFSTMRTCKSKNCQGA